jgi:hypothetical protein
LRFNGRFLRAPFLCARVNALAVDQAFFGSDFENAVDFGDGLRVERGAVIERRDKLADGIIEVVAPVRGDASLLLGVSPRPRSPMIEVIWNAGLIDDRLDQRRADQ